MPATLDEKQFTELNKSVQRIVKTLETAVGNTATQKAKKSEEEILADLRMNTAEQEAKTADKQEKVVEEQKLKFFDSARFMKASAAEYFAQTKTNQVTWGNFFNSLSEGYKKWFSEASKQRGALGATLRLGSSLWRAAHKHIIDNVRKLWGALTSQVSEVLGELGGVLTFVKDTFMSAFNFVKDTFMGMFAKVPPADKKRNKLLQAIVGYLRRDEKRDLLQKPTGKRTSLLGALALIAAATLGALIGKILLPFKTLMNAFKLGPIVKGIQTFFVTKFPVLGKLFTKLSGYFSKVGGFFTWFTKKVPFFGKLLKLFKFGFTKLAWPLQIIMSVIDFIKGFQATEGNLADKVIGGIKNAVLKFIELPVKAIGWIVEKVLGLFGVEVDGVADKIMGWVGKAIDIFYSLFRPILGFFEEFFASEGSFVDKLKAGLGGFFAGLVDMLNVFEPFIDWTKGIIDKVKNFFGGDDKEESTGYPDHIKTAKQRMGWDNLQKRKAQKTSPAPAPGVKAMANAEAKKEAEKQREQTEELKKTLDDNTKKQIDADKKIADEQAGATAIAMGGNAQSGPAESPANPLQDEIDIFGSLAGNNNF